MLWACSEDNGADKQAATDKAFDDIVFESTEIRVLNPWIRGKIGSRDARLYLQLRNLGEAPDELMGASTPLATSASVVRETDSESEKGEAGALTLILPPGETVALEPGVGGILMGEKQEPFIAGKMVPVTLHFRNAADLEIEAQIRFHPPNVNVRDYIRKATQ
ncbi:MAG: copper chaperone PCu(A)C [Alphaproteobacteria bacterium]